MHLRFNFIVFGFYFLAPITSAQELFSIPIPSVKLDPRLERLTLALPIKDFSETNHLLQKEESILSTQIVRPNVDRLQGQAQSFRDDIVPFEGSRDEGGPNSPRDKTRISDRSGISSKDSGTDTELDSEIQPPPKGQNGLENDWNKFGDRSLNPALGKQSISSGEVSSAFGRGSSRGGGGASSKDDDGYKYDKPGYEYKKPKVAFLLPQEEEEKPEGSENLPGYNYPKPSNPLRLPN